MRVRVTRNFQVVIPSEVRSKAGIREGDIVDVWYDAAEGVVKLRRVDQLDEIEEALKRLPKIERPGWRRLKEELYEMFD
ncbi:MAG: AbrB/MazE/SpoVT family DNA-binding domain-containing protein [Thermoproteus sp.]|nr:AbrB/MazE/SpoVT family DNA-binding domain-containing protein [Thermoproteus sp.]